MNKAQLIVAWVMVMFLAMPICQAQDSKEKVDWDKLERYLYQDLRAEHPDKSEAEIEQAIGYALLQSDNQWERATVHFRKALELNPGLHMSWYNLGLINADSEEGYNHFKKATEAKPDYPPPYYWMAYYRCRNREDKKAIPLFQKYLEVAKDDKQEAGRVKVAQEALQDLLTGREGQSLSMMRRPVEQEQTIARAIISPLSGEEVSLFLRKLNSQGVIVTYDKSVKNDEVRGGNPENSSFYLKGSDSWYFLYRADINNDGKDEYILCSASGSGGFFDIDAIYQEKSGKLTDIFNEIKIPLRKLVREAQKEDYDLEEGFSFMNGSIAIEKEVEKVFFTLEQTTRKYEGKGFEEDFNPPQGYKFLWDNSGIKLIDHYIGDKIYKE